MQMRSKKNIGKKGTKKNSTRKNMGKKSYKNRTRKNYSKKKKGGALQPPVDTFGLKAFVDVPFLDAAFKRKSTKSETQVLRDAHDSIKDTAQSTLISIINSLSNSEVTREFFHIDHWEDEDVKINEVVNIYTMLLYAVSISHKTKYTDVDLLNYIYKRIHRSYSEEYNEKYELLDPTIKKVFNEFKSLESILEELTRRMEQATNSRTHSFGGP